MSIIQEALKKAQRVRSPAASGMVLRASPAAISKPPAKKFLKPAFFILIPVLAFSVLMFGYFSLVSSAPRANPAAVSAEKSQVVPQLPPIVQEPAPVVGQSVPAAREPVTPQSITAAQQPVIQAQDTVKQKSFVLSGIMHLDNGLKAIINDSTVSEGDELDGAIVVKINEDNAILKDGDSQTTLRLKG